MKTSKFLVAMVLFFVSLQSSAGLLYNYSQLALKDLDQMNAIVQSKVKESKKSASGKTVPLKEALQAVYSRPNEDGMIEKVVGPLRTELDEHEAWEKVLNELTVEAIDVLRHPKSFKPIVQVTYAVFLENILLDMKPFATKPGFERSMVQKVKDAKIELNKEASAERGLRMMKSAISPSELADQILKMPAAPEAATEADSKTEPAKK